MKLEKKHWNDTEIQTTPLSAETEVGGGLWQKDGNAITQTLDRHLPAALRRDARDEPESFGPDPRLDPMSKLNWEGDDDPTGESGTQPEGEPEPENTIHQVTGAISSAGQAAGGVLAAAAPLALLDKDIPAEETIEKENAVHQGASAVRDRPKPKTSKDKKALLHKENRALGSER